MPVDSRNKRASALNTVPLLVMPTGDGTIDAADRQQVTWLYSGVGAGAAIVITSITPFGRTLFIRHSPRVIITPNERRVII